MAEIRVGSYVALVDDEDYERISAISWNVRIDRKNGCPYAEAAHRLHGEFARIARVA